MTRTKLLVIISSIVAPIFTVLGLGSFIFGERPPEMASLNMATGAVTNVEWSRGEQGGVSSLQFALASADRTFNYQTWAAQREEVLVLLQESQASGNPVTVWYKPGAAIDSTEVWQVGDSSTILVDYETMRDARNSNLRLGLLGGIVMGLLWLVAWFLLWVMIFGR